MRFETWYQNQFGVLPEEVHPNTDAAFQLNIAKLAWNAALNALEEELQNV